MSESETRSATERPARPPAGELVLNTSVIVPLEEAAQVHHHLTLLQASHPEEFATLLALWRHESAPDDARHVPSLQRLGHLDRQGELVPLVRHMLDASLRQTALGTYEFMPPGRDTSPVALAAWNHAVADYYVGFLNRVFRDDEDDAP